MNKSIFALLFIAFFAGAQAFGVEDTVEVIAGLIDGII